MSCHVMWCGVMGAEDGAATYLYDDVTSQLQPAVAALSDNLTRAMAPREHVAFDPGDPTPAEHIEDYVHTGERWGGVVCGVWCGVWGVG